MTIANAASLDEKPSARKSTCEYKSCPANSGPDGFNVSQPNLHWVNSYPVTSIRYGINKYATSPPELAVTGPNVGTNLFLSVPFSGTVGAASYAARQGIPALAFSGADGGRHAWDESPVNKYSVVYAEAATNFTNFLVAQGKPYLPNNVFLNINFPDVKGECDGADSYKYVLSRINPGIFSKPDVDWCGSKRLPTELDVYNKKGCYVPVSVGDAADKTTVNDERQQQVLDKLKSILVCLPK